MDFKMQQINSSIHRHQMQVIQEDQHNPIVDIISFAAYELPRLHIQTKEHPLSEVIGNLKAGVQTCSTTNIQNDFHFSTFISMVKPKFIKEALEHSNQIRAMQEELAKFEKNQVWTLFPSPQNHLIVGPRWVFLNKLDDARLIIQKRA